MLLLLKTFVFRQNAKKHKLSFYIWKKRLYFSSVANTASPLQMNLGERKEFLTNMIFVQQNKPHRVVQ